ncbi:anhydro-N-acetylmuramic acid kinase [Oscillatoriales cyanobacterium USR001]|nr:anhydro-N-acetylmuramic acid kinase [Oscillatoriales cyanobacterium USR001]
MVRAIGLISGTSVDGIDAALVDISGTKRDLKVELVGGITYPYPADLRSQILAVCSGSSLNMAELAQLDDAIAIEFSQAALTIQDKYGKAELIGSHGQTVYHRPPKNHQTTKEITTELRLETQNTLGYSLQLGRGALIAYLTGITTVSNFRVADIAAGGQGAPLVSIVDAYLLRHPTYNRCVQNLGGIGNVTYLPPKKSEEKEGEINPRSPEWGSGILGWDTGPGNSLLDLAVEHFSGGTKTYDRDGAWAKSGTPCLALVDQWLQQEFFLQRPPKSTGRELFGWDYFQGCLAEAKSENLTPADLLATLVELTAVSIAHSYRNFLPQIPDQVLLCGGGSRNLYLKERLQAQLAPAEVLTTSEAGLNADFKEAIAFAVLAYWRSCGVPGNLPEVTGAFASVLLGEINNCQYNQA